MLWFLLKLWLQTNLFPYRTEEWVWAYFFILFCSCEWESKNLAMFDICARVLSACKSREMTYTGACSAAPQLHNVPLLSLSFVHWDLWLGVHDSHVVKRHSDKKLRSKIFFIVIPLAVPAHRKDLGNFSETFFFYYFATVHATIR